MAKAAKKTTDDKVMELLETVKAKRAQIAAIAKPQWKTSASLELPGLEERVNLQVEKSIPKLVLCLGLLSQYDKAMQEGAVEAGVVIQREWKSYAINDWRDDIKQRIRILNIESERSKLAVMEQKLFAVTTEEQRREMQLAEVLSELGA